MGTDQMRCASKWVGSSHPNQKIFWQHVCDGDCRGKGFEALPSDAHNIFFLDLMAWEAKVLLPNHTGQFFLTPTTLLYGEPRMEQA